jgi:hypothetical protein
MIISCKHAYAPKQQQRCQCYWQGHTSCQTLLWLLRCCLQEWQLEAAAMLGRAEQLKVLLAHRQAHHLSLLAALLQLMHRQEVQEFDSPQPSRALDTGASDGQQCCALLLSSGSSTSGAKQLVTAGSCKQQGQGQPTLPLEAEQVAAAHVGVAAGLEVIAEGGDQDQEDDEFYMPVRSSSNSPGHGVQRTCPMH